MHFFPILSTLRRHRTSATLIVLEIALTCAIVCNAIFLIRARLQRMDLPSGVAEEELLRVRLTGIGTRSDAAALTEQDLAALREIPGVKFAAVTNMVPFGGHSWNSNASTVVDDPASPNAGIYLGSRDLLQTLGVRVVAGRGFTPEEYVAFDDEHAHVASVVITRGLAERLFPGRNPIGQKVYSIDKEPQTVVGMIDLLARPNEPGGLRTDPSYAMVLPATLPYTVGGNYVLRVDATRRAEVLAAIDATLNRINPNRILIEHQTFPEIRGDHFKQDRAMAYLLVGVSLALLIITALGVVGLASFWVQQRTRQIGVRRALGATRGDILRYFQLENFILATAGIVLGMALAYAINLWLMHKYAVERLPIEFLPVGAGLLWILGQIAVLGPAMRAATIPPAIATRTV
ncbi:MAG TPA: FtsX-like permease family protein [Kofleriaceae bacterium]